ncbi:MAG: UvrD-helicase domain-containing protein [Thermomicrobiales bacterium]
MIDVSPAQRRIVESPPDGRHLLVRAGPGSGKTRTIVARIDWLLTNGHCAPENILAMTSTLRAAEELRDRLAIAGHHAVWTGTFHHICARFLAEHGAAIGIVGPIRIYDSAGQLALLGRVADQLGIPFADRRGQRASDIQREISRRKCAGIQLGDPHSTWRPQAAADLYIRFDEAYCASLTEQGVFDFDDLLIGGVRLLREQNETETLRRRFRFIFVDEFHDVSPEQHALLVGLAPPGQRRWADQERLPRGGLMVVADSNQSIYGWRGADPQAIVGAYARRYAPITLGLDRNFRSSPAIIAAAATLILTGGPTRPAPARGVDPPVSVRCLNDERAAAFVASHIAARIRKGHHGAGDIAVLYRAHASADLAEQALLKAGIPLERVQQDRFFGQPDVAEALRLLDLVASLHDPSFVPALNWPRVVVDEVTMIRLRRLAARDGRRLSELAAAIDDIRDEITPLSRVAITGFIAGIADDLRPLIDGPLPQVVERMLHVLNRRRGVLLGADRDAVRGLSAFLTADLREPTDRLFAGVVDRLRITLRHGPGIDPATAAAILERVLLTYCAVPCAIESASGMAGGSGLTIQIGESAPGEAEAIELSPRLIAGATYGVALQAWRLGQMLLMRFEQITHEPFTVVDIETGGLHTRTTEIVDFAAVRVRDGVVGPEEWSTLIRPSKPSAISVDATNVHGLSWAHLRDAPEIAAAMPAFRSFLGDDVLVGHNIDKFDGKIITRIIGELGLPALSNPMLDTLKLAQRLLPGEPAKLEDLVKRFNLPPGQAHRAATDARWTGGVLLKLLEVMQAERELDALSEALPAVAVACAALGESGGDAIAAVLDTGARGLAMGHGTALLDRCARLSGDRAAYDGTKACVVGRPCELPEETERWGRFARRWREVADAYVETSDEPSLAGFLRMAALATTGDDLARDSDRVTMMTMHSAKGKEWPVVYLIGMEDGRVPNLWGEWTEGQIAEERRVLYVGMTRARDRLYFVWSENRDGRCQTRSRFLDELVPLVVDEVRWDGPARESSGA